MANCRVSQPEHLAGVAVGDVLWDAVNREWAVVDTNTDGLALQDADGEVQRFTWHGLLTLRARPDPA